MNPNDQPQQPGPNSGVPMPPSAPYQPVEPHQSFPQAPPPGYTPPQGPYVPPQDYAQPLPPGYPPQPPPGYGPPPYGQPPVAPPVRINPNSTQNSLEIAEIRDGIVIMNDGSFRSVVMTKSINFDLMSPQEREAVEYSYQGFLNSLYFPVQIFIRSQKVDLRPYIEKLDKIRTEHDNMLLALLMEDYITFIDSLAMQTNIMDKKFYIVIPFFPSADIHQAFTASKGLVGGIFGMFKNEAKHVVVHEADLEKAKTELRNRVQATLGGLMQCGVQGLPLDTQELIELYYDTYNPDTATRQELKNFEDLTAPIVTKGQGTAHQPNLDRELL